MACRALDHGQGPGFPAKSARTGLPKASGRPDLAKLATHGSLQRVQSPRPTVSQGQQVHVIPAGLPAGNPTPEGPLRPRYRLSSV